MIPFAKWFETSPKTGVALALFSLVNAFEDGVLVVANDISAKNADQIAEDIFMMRALVEEFSDAAMLSALVGEHYDPPTDREQVGSVR